MRKIDLQQKNYEMMTYEEMIAYEQSLEIDCLVKLLQLTTENLECDEEHAAMFLIDKAFKVAKYSSDYLDIALFIKNHSLEEFYDINICLTEAKKLAKLPADFLELENFNCTV